MSRNVQMEVLKKVQYTVFLVCCEIDEIGCCFQNHCSNSWSCDSAGFPNQLGGGAWYEEGGVVD